MLVVVRFKYFDIFSFNVANCVSLYTFFLVFLLLFSRRA